MEKTFTKYNKTQSNAYAAARLDYHPSVYQSIYDYHKSNGGEFQTILDVGCGPGQAVRWYAPHFEHAVGLDPSSSMLETAQELGGTTSTPEDIRYAVSSAEDLGQALSPPIADSSVDLITSANAAHWFDMSRFWPAAARVLKPGGSVALWTFGEAVVHKDTPGAEAVQAALDRYAETHLFPYYAPGNFQVRNRYVDLVLPWSSGGTARDDFDQSKYIRQEWNEEDGAIDTGTHDISLPLLEKMMRTTSPQTRWDAAHPDLVGTDQDELKKLIQEVEGILHAAGAEKGKEIIKGTSTGVTLMFHRK